MIPHDHLVRCALLIDLSRRQQDEAPYHLSLVVPVIESDEAERGLQRVCRTLRHT